MPNKQSQASISPKDLASNLGFATHLLEQQLPKDASQGQNPQDPQGQQGQAGQQVNPLETQFQQFETKVTGELKQLTESIQSLLKNEQAEPEPQE